MLRGRMLENTNWSPVGLADQPALGGDPGVQRRLRHRLQHARHRHRDAGVLDEAQLLLEDASRRRGRSRRSCRPAPGCRRTGPCGRCRPGRRAGSASSCVSSSDAGRGLSMPMKTVVKCAARSSPRSSSSCATLSDTSVLKWMGWPRAALHCGDRPQQLLGELLVADEVVVHEEDLLGPEPVALLDLGHHLRDASWRAAGGRRPR